MAKCISITGSPKYPRAVLSLKTVIDILCCRPTLRKFNLSFWSVRPRISFVSVSFSHFKRSRTLFRYFSFCFVSTKVVPENEPRSSWGRPIRSGPSCSAPWRRSERQSADCSQFVACQCVCQRYRLVLKIGFWSGSYREIAAWNWAFVTKNKLIWSRVKFNASVILIVCCQRLGLNFYQTSKEPT